MKLVNQFKQCLNALESNPNIELGKYSERNRYDAFESSQRLMLRWQNELLEYGVEIEESDFEVFNLCSIVLNWDSTLILGVKTLRGGFVFNGITDALCLPSIFWKGAVSLPPDAEVPQELKHFEKLGWFCRLPNGLGADYACFIKESGQFPPPIAQFLGYSNGRYINLDFDYYRYLELMFQNYGFKGWYYFYIDIPNDLPIIDDILAEMKAAVLTLPKLFPNDDWSFHEKKYDEVLKKLGK